MNQTQTSHGSVLPKSLGTEITFYILCVSYLLLDYILINHTEFFFKLDGEDGVVELAGAFLLLLTSVMLIWCGFKSKKNIQTPRYQSWVFFFVGLVFFWAAGEEISWGQHMFGHVTPEWLAKINGQQETNLHNINKKFFDRWQERIVAIVAMFTACWHFKGKRELWGFTLPEAPLALAFLFLPLFRRLDTLHLEVWHMGLLVFWVYVANAFKRKDRKILQICGVFIVASAVVYYVHSSFTHLFGRNNNVYHEIRETLFSVLCFVYSLQLWVAARGPMVLPGVMSWMRRHEG